MAVTRITQNRASEEERTKFHKLREECERKKQASPKKVKKEEVTKDAVADKE